MGSKLAKLENDTTNSRSMQNQSNEGNRKRRQTAEKIQTMQKMRSPCEITACYHLNVRLYSKSKPFTNSVNL